jgi:hypothetical protein
MEKFYSPPSGNYPQSLPDYWRFDNGTIRRDLQTLDDEELHAWGWSGPIYMPIQKRVIKNTEDLPEDYVNILINDETLEYDEENQEWVSVSYDYDSETHKQVWYSKNREFIILPIDEDTTEYDIAYKSEVILPTQDDNSDLFLPTVSPEPPAFTLNVPPASWEQFRNDLVSSLEFNQYIASLMPVLPIVATSFPISILQLEMGRYSSFRILWKTLENAELLPPEELKQSLIALANQYNLPQDFIRILTGE